MKTNEQKTAEYTNIIDHYTNQLTPVGAGFSQKAIIRVIVSKLARDIMHWTNDYNDHIRAQVDDMMDKAGY